MSSVSPFEMTPFGPASCSARVWRNGTMLWATVIVKGTCELVHGEFARLIEPIEMGPARTVTAAFTVLVGGMPLARLSSATIQNSTNAPGAKVMPSVTNVLVLAPRAGSSPMREQGLLIHHKTS
jgi:hypothetical protein